MKYRLARTRSLSREAAALCQPRASAAPPWGTVPNTGLALKGQHSREPGISAALSGLPDSCTLRTQGCAALALG